jgi:hypothetical protein
VRYKLLRFKRRLEQPLHSNCCLALCGSAADSWYDVSEELSFANAAIHSRNAFRVASRLRPRFSGSGLSAAGKLLALTQEAYGAVVSFRRAN